jgi:FkbM family methyltransferase
VEILKKYSDRIIWESEKDNGQSDAINKGLRMATGDIVAYLNSDDTYEPGALKKVADYFENPPTGGPEKKWVYGQCRIINEKDDEIRKPITWYKNVLGKKYSYGKLLAENFICQPAVFWRRELLDEIGYFNKQEHFCMDYEYWLRIGKKYPAGVINEYLANFRYHKESKSGSVNKKQFLDELQIAKKYGNGYVISILAHKINYYKIIFIYSCLLLFNKAFQFFGIKFKNIFHYIKFIIKLALNKEVFSPIQIKIPKKFIGSETYGGWFISPLNINEKSIIYSFGIGENISFDLDLVRMFNCKIFAFDPTPKSRAWLKKQILPENLKYYEIGLSSKDDTVEMFPPKNPKHVSFSIISKNNDTTPIKMRVARLKTIMQDLGHLKIDILKMDIEGSEYEAIDDILKSEIKINQILVEFHHRFPKISTRATKKAMEQLSNAGYKIFAVSSSREEYSFIKSK